jgi:hypothetical protein
MQLEIGNPQVGPIMVVDIPDDATKEHTVKLVQNALAKLKVSVETWRSWSIKHETDMEKRAREAAQEGQELQVRANEMNNRRMRAMLDGDIDGPS